MADKETWTNMGRGSVYILTFDHTGKLRSTPVRPGAKVTVSTEERQINQERAFTADVDSFKNGTFVPVILADSVEDFHEIASNPNHLSEDDMRDMFKLKAADFKKKLVDITNVIAIERMHEMAESETAGTSVSMAQFRALEGKLKELNSDKLDIVEITEVRS